jgi:hypothetical protein
MNYQLLAEKFWRQGYLSIDNFFNTKLMDNYQSLILSHFAKNPQFAHNEEFLSKSNTDVIPWFPQREGFNEFDIAERDSRMIELTEAILGPQWSALYSMVMYSQKGSKGQSWHQDCPPEDNDKFNLNRLVYSMDVDDQVGGNVIVVPGTHISGPIPVGAGDEDLPEQRELSPKKGTLILIHGHLWHRVLPVRGSYRVSTNYRCCPKNTPEDITDICVYRNMRYCFSHSKVVEERL